MGYKLLDFVSFKIPNQDKNHSPSWIRQRQSRITLRLRLRPNDAALALQHCFKAPFPINSSYFLKYLHVVHKGGAGTGAVA
jgi:hypothetical protein